MLWVYLCASLVAAVGGQEGELDHLTVTINQGSLKGYKAPGTNVFVFYGVPYATAPTGTEKFKAPLPPPSWTNTFEATDSNIHCPQPGLSTHADNCLIANIYVPDTNQTNLSVFINVHGGAFQLGSANDVSPFGLLSTRDIIAINFNYRLGVHGFLCLGTEDAPGNAGMKDQVALLKWVNENIGMFGGNPDDVTIAGCSAGGVAVDLLRIVSVTDGLFNKVITESGTSVATFGVQVDPIENAKIYASILGFENVDDIAALEEFYKTAPLELLYSRFDLIIDRFDSTVLFVPCVEKDIGVEIFLEDAPVNIIRKGLNKVLPTLYGFANMEGLMHIKYFDDWHVKMNENFIEFVPADLKFESDEQRDEVAQRIKNFYFGEQPIDSNSIESFVDYMSDILFIYSMLNAVKLHKDTRNEDNFYLYEYSFINEITQNYPGNVRGANHCEQIIAVFDENETNIDQDYRDIKELMRKIYINFITNGVPIVDNSPIPLPWLPADVNRDPYMAIGANITLGERAYEDRAKFWDELYEHYYRAPIAPNNAKVFTIVSSTWMLYTLVLLISN